MPFPQTPALANATEDAFAGLVTQDPRSTVPAGTYGVYGGNFYAPVQSEAMGLWGASVADKNYRKTWTCGAGDAVGDPVRVSGNDTVTKALATTAANAKVVGFIRYKPTATTCYLSHYRRVTGLSGGTAGNSVFLTNAGGYGSASGTSPKIIGEWNSTTEADVYADAISSIGMFNDAEGDPSLVSLAASADGTSSYAARRDHVHQLDVTIVPTWSGRHYWTAAGYFQGGTYNGGIASVTKCVAVGYDLTADVGYVNSINDTAAWTTLTFGGSEHRFYIGGLLKSGLDQNNNWLHNQAVAPATMAGGYSMLTGIAPTGYRADQVTWYSADIGGVATGASWHLWTEGFDVANAAIGRWTANGNYAALYMQGVGGDGFTDTTPVIMTRNDSATDQVVYLNSPGTVNGGGWELRVANTKIGRLDGKGVMEYIGAAGDAAVTAQGNTTTSAGCHVGYSQSTGAGFIRAVQWGTAWLPMTYLGIRHKFYNLGGVSFYIDDNRNFGNSNNAGGVNFGTSAAQVQSWPGSDVGTAAPQTGPADTVQAFAFNLSAGNAGWFLKGEAAAATGFTFAFGGLVGATGYSVMHGPDTPSATNYICARNLDATDNLTYFNGTGGIQLCYAGAGQWQVRTDAHFKPTNDNTVDLGTAALRPRDVYASRNVLMSGDRAPVFTNQTSAAAASLGTLTNAPAAGDPSYWLKISINGANKAIPCWAG